MIILELKTVSVHESGCYSVLLNPQRIPFAVTLERTFENLRTVLQNGDHRCHRDKYHKGGYETFEIEVEGHDRVLFHIGNWEENSEGCVLIAESFDQLGIKDSRGGFAEFMKILEGRDVFILRVSGR